MSTEQHGARFPELLRTPRHRWWKPVVGALFAVVVVLTSGTAVIVAAVLAVASQNPSRNPFSEEALDPATPLGLLGMNLAIAMLTPAVLLTAFVVHRQRPGFLCSVIGRLRWRLLGRLLVIALVVTIASYAVTLVLFPSDGGSADLPQTPTLLMLLSVIALTTPLQAAGEEFAFRGYLTQAISSWFARPLRGAVVAAVVTSLLFALAHGAQDAWLFGDRFVFGLVASWLVYRTGGLEAPVALHAANNLVALGAAAFTGELGSALTTTTVDWEFAVADIATVLAFAIVADRLATRWRVAVVSAGGAVGYPGKRP